MTHPPHNSSLPSKTRQETTAARTWRFWPLLPLYPYGYRRTLRCEVIPDTLWTFEQLQGIFYVVVPIRMTVVKLAAGGLLVYAPVAPTEECVRLVNELVARHGAVKYIVLPTVSGLEHKVYAGPFARRFPTAQVYVSPHQWSFPLNLPLSWLGFPRDRTHVLPPDSQSAPFGDEFDYAQLGPVDLGVAPFEEIALFHRPSRSLLVTDSIVAIPSLPPDILQQDPYPMLFHARETGQQPVIDTRENRIKGWKRIALFSMYFQPSCLEVPRWGEVFQDARKGGDRSAQAYFGLYPFRWRSDWEQSFEALRGNGRLLVAPILQQLIFNRGPQIVLAWADRVAKWDFQRIIPCHLDCPLVATPQQFRQAFAFLDADPPSWMTTQAALPMADLVTMQQLDNRLNRLGITSPAKPLSENKTSQA